LPNLILQPNTRGGTAEKISNSPSRKFVGATQKKKIKQATKSKTNGLASNAILSPSKRHKRGFAGIQLRLTLNSTTDLAVPFTDDSTEEGNNVLIVCSVLVVSLKTAMEKSGYDVRNISDGRTHCVLVWRKILFVSLFRNKHCFDLSLYPLYL
jgi:hypothetical protein